MKVIGFNFTKFKAEKNADFKQSSSMNTSIEFLDLSKEEVSLLKDSEVIKLFFRHTFSHILKEEKKEIKQAEVAIDGIIILSLSKEEAKEIKKFWKKKQLPEQLKIVIFNIILRKCLVKSIVLEEEIGLPLRIPVPHVSIQAPEDQEQN
ncbi:MAG: hypothetical protein Q7S74_02595 [Nanoarchaeota archaeon]|nr:hypothetical protein [Nanoarchaeota archaeon]